MKVSATLRTAAHALARNKMRSLLTALGIIIGVASVIAMVSVGDGAKAQVETQIASLGQNVILVMSGTVTRGGISTGWGSAGTLTLDDERAIRREVTGVVATSPEVRQTNQVAAAGQNWSTQVMGESPDYFDIRQWPFTEGEAFGEREISSAAKVAVLGATVATQLFGNRSPLGETIRIRNVPFQVIGVLSRKGTSIMGSDQDDTIIIPYTSAMKRMTGSTNLRSIQVKAATPELMATVQQQINALLRQRHRIEPGKDDDFMVRSQDDIAQMATATSKVMTLLLGAIASVSLVVGGIGIMNIMLVSVTERTREIGIRMAVGARGRDILLQFLIEAIALSSIGGIVGIALGAAVSKILSATAGWAVQISLNAILLSFFFSAAVGVFFGFYPARRASELDPIEALRYE